MTAMASVHKREWRTGTRWNVMWRQDGRQMLRPFYREKDANDFRGLVEVYNEHLPPPHVWDDVHRCLAEQSPSGAPTFRAYAEQLIHDRTRIAEGTRRDYLSQLARHVYPVIGDAHIDQLTRSDLAKLVRALNNKGLAAKTKANLHGLVSSLLKDAVTDGLLDRNPAIGVMRDVPSVRSESMVFLTPPEFDMILNHIPEHYRPLARFSVGTGLRWGEATALQVQDIELFGRPVVHVRRAWKNHQYRVSGEPKTARSRRTLALSEELKELLIPLVSARESTELVFTNTFGRPINHGDFYRKVWQPAVAAAQQDGLRKSPRWHDLRHTHVTWLIADNIALPAIQARMGHESIRTTIDRYGHLLPDLDNAINAAVDRALAPQT